MLSDRGQQKLQAFRDKINSLGDSSSDDDGDSDDRPSGASASIIVTFKRRRLGESSSSAPTYSSLSAAISITRFSSLGSGIPFFRSGVSTAPLFSTFPSLAGSVNLFATSVGISSSTVPPVFTTSPPGSSLGSIHPHGVHPASPRLKQPVMRTSLSKSLRKFLPKVASDSIPPGPIAPTPPVSS
ncbi:hypothetical protein Hanom_Chr07g00636261 [Helianthus anomalus]